MEWAQCICLRLGVNLLNIHPCRNPEKNQRPTFSDLHATLSDRIFALQMKRDEIYNQQNSQAHTIGAPLDASKELFKDLQNTYIHE